MSCILEHMKMYLCLYKNLCIEHMLLLLIEVIVNVMAMHKVILHCALLFFLRIKIEIMLQLRA